MEAVGEEGGVGAGKRGVVVEDESGVAVGSR